MKIVADLSLYPLKDGPVPEIIRFIKDIREQDGIEIVTNQLSTQLRGEFEAVTGAINHCMRAVMARLQQHRGPGGEVPERGSRDWQAAKPYT